MGDAIMAVSYNKLWKLLVDKKMSKSDLRKKAEIAPNTMTKLRRDEEVSLTILSKICKTLNADFGDIVRIDNFDNGYEVINSVLEKDNKSFKLLSNEEMDELSQDELKKYYEEIAGLYTGDVSVDERNKIVENFQNPDKKLYNFY